MAEDDLLTRLGALVREEERESDPELEKLVQGTSTPEELRTLRTRAEADPALEVRIAQLTPMDDGVRQRIVQQAIKEHLQPKAKVVELRPRKKVSWLAPAAVALSAAAAVLLMVRSPEVAELPGYSLSAKGGVDVERGSTREGPIVLAPDSTLQLVLRPASDVEGPLHVKALVRAGSQLDELVVHPEISPSGSIRIRELSSALFGARTGAHELLVITCRPEACESALSELREGKSTRGPGWESHAQPLLLER
jgi:hypothetical protein